MDQALPPAPRFWFSCNGTKRSEEWTEDQVRECVKMFNENFSMKDIGIRLGRSRNAVAGMLRRQRDKGILDIKEKGVITRKHKKLPASEKKYLAASIVRVRLAPPPPPKPVRRVRLRLVNHDQEVTLVELQQHNCRWPLGDPKQADFRFCGCTVQQFPYCEYHTEVAVKGSENVR